MHYIDSFSMLWISMHSKYVKFFHQAYFYASINIFIYHVRYMTIVLVISQQVLDFVLCSARHTDAQIRLIRVQFMCMHHFLLNFF